MPFGGYPSGITDTYCFDGIPDPQGGQSADEGKRFQISLTQTEPCSWKWATNSVNQLQGDYLGIKDKIGGSSKINEILNITSRWCLL